MSLSHPNDIFEKLRTAKTMPELDALRFETVAAMKELGHRSKEQGEAVQKAFIAAKNRLRRIPVKDRTW